MQENVSTFVFFASLFLPLANFFELVAQIFQCIVKTVRCLVIKESVPDLGDVHGEDVLFLQLFIVGLELLFLHELDEIIVGHLLLITVKLAGLAKNSAVFGGLCRSEEHELLCYALVLVQNLIPARHIELLLLSRFTLDNLSHISYLAIQYQLLQVRFFRDDLRHPNQNRLASDTLRC